MTVIRNGIGWDKCPLRTQRVVGAAHGKRHSRCIACPAPVGLRVPACKGIACLCQGSRTSRCNGLALQVAVVVHRRRACAAAAAVIDDGVGRERGPPRIQRDAGGTHYKCCLRRVGRTAAVGLCVPSNESISCFHESAGVAEYGNGRARQIVVAVNGNSAAGVGVPSVGHRVGRICGPLRIQRHVAGAHDK